MSTQTSDLPDFFKGDQWSNPVPFVNEQNVLRGSGTIVWGPFFMAAWDSVVVSLVSADVLGCTVHWWSDVTLTNELGRQAFDATANKFYADCLPALGPFVTFETIYHTGAGTVLTSTIITPSKGVFGWKRNVVNLIVLGGVSTTIGAATFITVHAAYVTTGVASWCVTSNAAAWEASLWATDSLGVKVAQLAHVTTTDRPIPAATMLCLPARKVILEIVNNDAAARQFSYGLVLDPR